MHNPKVQLRLAALLLSATGWSLIGCAHDPIADRAAALKTAPHPLTDSFYIKQAVLQDFFDLQAKGAVSEKSYYSAYVLNDKDDGNDLVASFAGYVPTVSNTVDVSTSTGEARDQKTGKPVKLFTVKIMEQSPDSATVRASWYSASIVGESDEYSMAKADGKWQVNHRRVMGSS